MEISNKLIGEQLSLWTSSAADTPANHSAPQENDEAQTTHDTYGHGYETPLAHYDPDTRSWKTSGDISLWGEQPSLESLPKSGMTRNGALYQQPDWVRPIDVTGSSLWPTPTAHPNNTNKTGKFKNPTLRDAVLDRMWPTPRSSAAMAENLETVRKRVERRGRLGSKLEESVALWPTPTFGKLAGGTGGMQQIEAKYSAGEITSEERRAMRAGNGGKLNPTWVEWLMGFPIGWTDLED
jgi:DNA (cytosine-5)-methyltransferase 1